MSKPIVYSKPACVQCNATYNALTKKGIDFDVVDVSEDEAALARVLELGYQQVPVLVHEVEAEGMPLHWSGYRPDLIGKLAQLVAVEVTV